MPFSANANSLLVYRDEISRCKRFYAGKNARPDCITTTATQRSILHMHVAVQWIESLDRFLARGIGFPHFPRLFLISSFMCPVASKRTVAFDILSPYSVSVPSTSFEQPWYASLLPLPTVSMQRNVIYVAPPASPSLSAVHRYGSTRRYTYLSFADILPP